LHPGINVVAADLYPARVEELALSGDKQQRIRFAALDVCNRAACLALMKHVRPTHILHAAAVTVDDQERMTNVNLHGTANVLDAAAASGSVERCIVLSSSGLYRQDGQNSSCKEDDELDLRSHYASTKWQAELLMPACEAAGGFAVAAGVGPVYGPFERERMTRPRVSLIGRLLEHYREGRAVSIAGSEMHRDWTHAADVAAALDLLLFAPALHHRVYNVSAGVAYSARQVIQLFEKAGLAVRWVSAGEHSDLVLDPHDGRKPLEITRLVSDTGFIPRFQLQTGIADMIASQQSRRVQPPCNTKGQTYGRDRHSL
jgi:nucleoside-diphosphate-sugar epimerase